MSRDAGAADRGPRCPACEGAAFRELFVKKGRHFWRCEECRLELQHPLPGEVELREYYERAYVDGMYRTFADASAVKQHTARHRLRALLPRCRPGRWLDVGASVGVFVEAARAEGIEAEGIDFARPAVEEARARDIPVTVSTLDDFDPGYRFDTITAFDVLEHVLDPVGFLHALRRLLVPGGTCALAFPDQASLYRRIMGRRWFYYIPEEHLHYFNGHNIRLMLERAGLNMLDSFGEAKPLNIDYMHAWLGGHGPRLAGLFGGATRILGRRVRSWSVPIPVGDLVVIAERPAAPDGDSGTADAPPQRDAGSTR